MQGAQGAHMRMLEEGQVCQVDDARRLEKSDCRRLNLSGHGWTAHNVTRACHWVWPSWRAWLDITDP
jgi:hypothetical protein